MRAALVSVMLIAGLCSCDGSGSGETSRQGTATSDSTKQQPSRTAAADDLVKRYVAAVVAGSFDDAMKLRCTSARLRVTVRQLWVDQARRLIAASGHPSVTGVQIIPSDGLQPVAPLTSPFEVRVTLTYPRGGAGDIEMIVGDEQRNLRLCGTVTPEAKSLHSSLETLNDSGSTAVQPRALMPASARGNERLFSDGPVPEPPGPYWLSDWSRVWETGNYGGDRVSALRAKSDASAQSEGMREREAVLSDGVGSFTVPGLPGAVGVRFLADAWTYVQTPAVGPYIDQTLMRFGSTLVSIEVADIPTGGDQAHGTVIAYANRVAALAGRPAIVHTT